MKKGIWIIAILVLLVLSINGCSSDNSYSTGNYSSSSRTRCQFEDENGNRVCTNNAMPGGQLCKYHFDYLDKIYHNIYDGLTSP